MSFLGEFCFCSRNYPCTLRNVLCAPLCWSTLGCCRGSCLVSYDDEHQKRRYEQQRRAPAAVSADPKAPLVSE